VRVEAGAYVVLQVKYGLITLVKQTMDLCDQVKNVDLDCPIEGDVTITKDVDLPREIPPVCLHVSLQIALANQLKQGLYTVLADAYTKDDDKLTCLTAKVRFGGH
jgi:ML domain